MNANPDSALTNSLAVEWERIALLACMLIQSRRGEEISQQQLQSLQKLQWDVEQTRDRAEQWTHITPEALSFLEQDILACVVAPEVDPRIGRLFQSLQPGLQQPYPTIALLQELLAITPEESGPLYAALAEESPLRTHRLVEIEGNNPYLPITPSANAVVHLLNRPMYLTNLPATTRIIKTADWDDLVLPPDRLAVLKEFLLWIRLRHIVVNEWGGHDCGGPIALFSGPSGTGKTFAAMVIAGELGWPLYRVDLGALVSKYIGETEKNLNRLFDAAHGQPVILQFDEAESLFSRRGEVKEARDRYANMEVSHLLARIEAHHGPVILTTNMRKHLDAAFARRFQIVVDFPWPDCNARELLWGRLLPKRAPYLPEVDPVFLGKAVNLTGGNIRNAALHAAYLAAGSGEPVNLSYIALAVWRELAKDGQERSLTDLGTLAQYLPEGLNVQN